MLISYQWETTFFISHNFYVPTGHADGAVVEAVSKDRDPEKDFTPRGSSQVVPQSPSSYKVNEPLRSSCSRPTDQPGLQGVLSHPDQPNPAAPHPPGYTFNKLLLPLFIRVRLGQYFLIP